MAQTKQNATKLNTNINNLLEQIGSYSPAYEAMPTIVNKSPNFDNNNLKKVPPKCPPKPKAFNDVYNGSEATNGCHGSNENNAMSNPVEHTFINDEIYAVVDKNIIDKKRTARDKGTTDVSYPPSIITKPQIYDDVEVDYSKQEQTNMDNRSRILIKNHHRRISDGMINTGNVTKKKQGPPPIPKPFSLEHKWDLPTHVEEQTCPYQRTSVSTDDMLGSCSNSKENSNKDKKIRSPNSEKQKNSYVNGSTDKLTSNKQQHNDRSVSTGCLTNSLNESDLWQLRELKKTHRSHESFDRTFHSNSIKELNNPLSTSGEFEIDCSSNSTLDSNKSEEDLGRLLSSRESGNDVFRDAPNELADVFPKINDPENQSLPEGWQEVREGAEIYYWHIWTGTIQYERPARPATTSSSSRSISPFSGNGSSHSRESSLSDHFDDGNMKSTCISPTAEAEKAKQVISFPVHSMGWMHVEEELMSPKRVGDTVNNCIITLAEKRHDLWNVTETWADGADIKLVLEGETLKLIGAKTKEVIHVQPIAKMRVWGVGKTETRDFAYIARDQATAKHQCHMFRCHGHLSARSITNALHAICNRVLDEKRKAKERSESPSYRVVPSDLMRPPPRSGNAFNEKPYTEQKKCFTAKYVGSTEVLKSSGIDVVNKTVAKLTDGQQTSDWPSVLLEVTTSEIRTVDCVKQETTLEHRVRFISFLGVAHDERFGAYIVAIGKEAFMCNVFFCAPHAGTLTKAIEEACKLRFEKMLDGKVLGKPSVSANQSVYQPSPEPDAIVAKPIYNPTAQLGHSLTPLPPQRGLRDKTEKLTSSIAGVFSKLNKKTAKKKEEDTQYYIPGPNEHLVKYFGSVSVDIGTGVDTVQKAVSDLSRGEMMIGYIEILSDCVSLSDSQRTALSKRFFDFNTISYCGMTSDRKHFGIIISRGKGKYTCHVFEEYKVNCGEIVSAIHEVL